ncbi:hypothetical protein Ga0061079_12010 [Apibacter mensalis]|uniref:Uncharacterized protein n=1 Tax=Apibacter mensalis TaxID=1586267 RepID=A0A110BK33_9FLAO|nr:hypothetical protein [Apibacter mensalis]CVK17195.1 hypothetical protein Ga0061079_12010 [Apibacter mensalis]
MYYNAENPIEAQRAKEYFNWLIKHKKMFELTKKQHFRSLSQNNYLYLLLGFFALEYGDTLEYIKLEIFKKKVNRDLFKTEFINRKTGEIRESWKSTASLNTKEMTTAIERFRNYSAKEYGFYLPEPKDLIFLNEIRIQIENNKEYL